jgi:hypothetical protein
MRGALTSPSPATDGQGRGTDRRSRFTVDLDQHRRRTLARFAVDHDAEMAWVVRIMVDLLGEGETLADEIARRLASGDGR